jgi:hypothetical protein
MSRAIRFFLFALQPFLFSGERTVRELGPKGLNPTSILSSVLNIWPVFNVHTDLTAIYNPSANFSQTMWWGD